VPRLDKLRSPHAPPLQPPHPPRACRVQPAAGRCGLLEEHEPRRMTPTDDLQVLDGPGSLHPGQHLGSLRSTHSWVKPSQSPTSPLAPFRLDRRRPGSRDVLIKIRYCGVCHTDIHFVRNDWGISMYPIVPGHEIVGVVESCPHATNPGNPMQISLPHTLARWRATGTIFGFDLARQAKQTQQKRGHQAGPTSLPCRRSSAVLPTMRTERSLDAVAVDTEAPS
jgi:hypothetical protein